MPSDNPTNTKPVLAHCNKCLQSTMHDRHGLVTEEHEEVDEEHNQLIFGERLISELLQCRGCGNTCMKQTYQCSEEELDTITIYPPSISRRKPDWLLTPLAFQFSDTQRTLRELFSEVYAALYAKSYRLAAMGTRAIVDVALTDKLGDIGGFDQKLNKASSNGWISEKQKSHLHTAVDTGSAAAHRAYLPNPAQISTVLDIVEHVIQVLYVLDNSAQSLSKQIPQRNK